MAPPPALGPLAATAVRLDALSHGDGPRLVYADLDLAERADLRRALGLPPAPLGDASGDAALVLAAHRRWGADAPAHLGGQFAYALWEPGERRLVAARDPVGLRPLFWARVGDAVVLGGDLRAILATGLVPDDLDDDVMAAVLIAGWFHPAAVGRTCLRGVAELRGGHRLVAGPDGAREAPYWRPEATPQTGPSEPGAIGEALRALLREVLAEAVAGEPPGSVGVHLSSGIDSTAVAAFAAEALGAQSLPPPRAFAWQPPPPPGPLPDEHARIEAVAARWALPLAYCPTTVDIAFEGRLLDATRDPVTMWTSEEPVRHAARAEGVGVVLSGWGGDEAVSFSGRGLVEPHLLRTGRWRALAAHALRDPVDAARRARRMHARRAGSRDFPSLTATRDAVLRGEAGTFAHRDLLRRADLPTPEAAPAAPHAYMGWLLRDGHLGTRAGDWARAGAPFGLGYRYPLLDRRVVAFALSLPDEAWLTRRRRRRWPLRDAAAGLVPDAVRLGPKDEPHWLASHRFEGTTVFHQLLPLLTPEVARRRAAWIDVDALRAALEDVFAGTVPDGRPPGGFQALSFLGLGDSR